MRGYNSPFRIRRATAINAATSASSRTVSGTGIRSKSRSKPDGDTSKSVRLFGFSGGGGGNRTAGSSLDSDDSRTVSRTGIDENTSKQCEQNVLPDILMTMSQIPDVNRELAEGGAMFAVFDAIRRTRER